jgi:hypothetical protein
MPHPRLTLPTALLLLPASAPAAPQDAAHPPDIVVTGTRPDILVNGRLPSCVRRSGDPGDAVDVSLAPAGAQMMIARDPASGQFLLARDNDPIGGTDWQRAGTAIRDYVFRAPSDGSPLCIGAHARFPRGFGQLRQIVDAVPYRGRGVRFSGYIATNKGADVRLWLAVGVEKRGVIAGNGTPTGSLDRRRGWKPFALEIPYVPKKGWSISYGFLLEGPGDVWVYEPRLEPLPSRGKGRQLLATPIR